MAQGFKFELMAASYGTPRGTITKPFSITLAVDDPLISNYRGNRSFKETPVEISDDHPRPKKAKADDEPEKLTGFDALYNHLPKNTVQLLIDNGYKTLSDILEYCSENGKTFWEYVEDYEGPEIWDFLKDVWEIMKSTIVQGLDNEGVLPGEIKLPRKASMYFMKAQKKGN